MAKRTKRINSVEKTIDDGAGGKLKVPENVPVWFDAEDLDMGFRSRAVNDVFEKATQIAQRFTKSHPDSHPPVVAHLCSNNQKNERWTSETLQLQGVAN